MVFRPLRAFALWNGLWLTVGAVVALVVLFAVDGELEEGFWFFVVFGLVLSVVTSLIGGRRLSKFNPAAPEPDPAVALLPLDASIEPPHETALWTIAFAAPAVVLATWAQVSGALMGTALGCLFVAGLLARWESRSGWRVFFRRRPLWDVEKPGLFIDTSGTRS